MPTTAPTLLELNTCSGSIKQLAATYGLFNIRVFGSVARQEATFDSDIDLLVDAFPTTSELDVVGFINELSALLHRNVDVVTAASLHWFIRDSVLNDAVEL